MSAFRSVMDAGSCARSSPRSRELSLNLLRRNSLEQAHGYSVSSQATAGPVLVFMVPRVTGKMWIFCAQCAVKFMVAGSGLQGLFFLGCCCRSTASFGLAACVGGGRMGSAFVCSTESRCPSQIH